MPPKPQYNQAAAQQQKKKEQESGWTKSSTMQNQQDAASKKSLDFSHAAGKVATSVDEAAENLRTFITKSIHDNNVLGLPDDEIKNMSKLLMQTPNKTEIYDWAQTLMQPKTFAEEIIRQRDIAAARFAAAAQQQQQADDAATDDGTASIATTAASSATARKKGGKGARGKVVNLGKGGAAGDGSDALIEGALFECGCYAASHPFRSNCANCGRIFCMQESDEVCYSCQLPPQSCLALELKQALGKVSDAADRKDKQGLEVALERRDKLLLFARERAKRTTVIDDQSGSNRATALGATADPWSTRAEREKAQAAGEEERRRVADMHKRTGAVAVHLDIVNSCVQLGATPLTKEKQQEEGDDDDQKKNEEEKISMGLGFGGVGGDQQQQQQKPSTTTASSSKPLDLKKKMNKGEEENNEDEKDSSDNEEQEDDDDEFYDDDGARRVVALPSLVSKIFYCKDDKEAEEKTKIKATLKQSQNAGNLYVGGGKKHTQVTSTKNDNGEDGDDGDQKSSKPRKVDFRRPEDKKESVSGTSASKGENHSRRVQVDYFEGDNDTWLMAEQQDEMFENKTANATTTSSNQNNNNSNIQKSSYSSSGAVRAHQRNETNRAENMLENDRLMNITMEDAASWKDNSTSGLVSSTTSKYNKNGNDDDDDNEQNQNQQVPLTGIDNSLLLTQQRAKKLFHKDEGWCLSMHQPWASLLIAGIKTHEGRTWPTEWRGRLWIHAAAAKPQQDTINEVEAHARQFVPEDTKFPSTYPTKCLLGCVSLADCFDRDRYESTFPPEQQQLGEASTHCFYCMFPKALPFPLAMDGQHKIYKLDKKHWHAARKLFKEPLL